MKLKHITPIVLAFFMMASCTQPTPLNRQIWTGTVTSSQSDCHKIGKNLEGDYQLIVEFGKADTLLLTVAKSGHVFKGLKSVHDTSLFVFTTSYSESGGILSETMQINLTEHNLGIGTSQWAWSNGFQTCRGTYEFTVKRME